jgi:glycosyltransferase involved in cell wall biosynthesis
VRILIINQCFYPDVAATAQHAWDLARHMQRKGYTVTAVASRSAYGERGNSFAKAERVDDVLIERIGTNRFGKAGLLGRAIDFAAFYLLATWRVARLPKQDVVICLTTPPFVVLIGLLLKAMRGSKVIYWVMDLYPDIAVSFGAIDHRSPVARVLSFLHRWALQRCDGIVVLGRCMRDRILAKGVSSTVLEVINTWSNPDEVAFPEGKTNEFRTRWAPNGEVLLMYSGNFGLGHDFETLVNALASLPPLPSWRIALVGGGKRKAEFMAMLRSQTSCQFAEAPHQPREQLGELLCAADIHLVTLKNGFEGLMVPSKFYGAMSAGKPVLFIGPRTSEVALAIQDSCAGVVVEPGDADSLKRALAEVISNSALRAEMASRALQSAKTKWSSEIALERWSDLIERISRG